MNPFYPADTMPSLTSPDKLAYHDLILYLLSSDTSPERACHPSPGFLARLWHTSEAPIKSNQSFLSWGTGSTKGRTGSRARRQYAIISALHSQAEKDQSLTKAEQITCHQLFPLSTDVNAFQIFSRQPRRQGKLSAIASTGLTARLWGTVHVFDYSATNVPFAGIVTLPFCSLVRHCIACRR